MKALVKELTSDEIKDREDDYVVSSNDIKGIELNAKLDVLKKCRRGLMSRWMEIQAYGDAGQELTDSDIEDVLESIRIELITPTTNDNAEE